MDAAPKGRQLLKSPQARIETEVKGRGSQQESRQSCKTLKLVSKNVPPTHEKSSGGPGQHRGVENERQRKQSDESDLTEDRHAVRGSTERLQHGLPEQFYQSDTYRCIMKEKETTGFVKRVRRDIELELAQRTQSVKELKSRLQSLIDKERHLLMALDGEQVQNELDLGNL